MSEKIADYWALKPSRFRYLESLDIRRVVDDRAAEPYCVTITLMEEPRAESSRGRFVFYGVQNLKIGSLEGLVGLLVEVSDESSRQLENLRLRVVETEHQAFAFWCQDFDFSVLPPPGDEG